MHISKIFELMSSIEMIKNILGNKASDEEIMFMLFFLADSLHNTEDLTAMAKMIEYKLTNKR